MTLDVIRPLKVKGAARQTRSHMVKFVNMVVVWSDNMRKATLTGSRAVASDATFERWKLVGRVDGMPPPVWELWPMTESAYLLCWEWELKLGWRLDVCIVKMFDPCSQSTSCFDPILHLLGWDLVIVASLTHGALDAFRDLTRAIAPSEIHWGRTQVGHARTWACYWSQGEEHSVVVAQPFFASHSLSTYFVRVKHWNSSVLPWHLASTLSHLV